MIDAAMGSLQKIVTLGLSSLDSYLSKIGTKISLFGTKAPKYRFSVH